MATGPDDPDHELYVAWKGGDRDAGSKLLERRVREITWFFRNKVFDEADVADLVGQTFLGCVSARDRYRGETSFRRFLYTIAQNVLREYLRAKAKRAREKIDFTQVCVRDLDPRSPSSIQMHQRELTAFVDALREVPLEDQIVLELKYFESMTGLQMAELLGIPEGTVRGRLRRGLERLRERVHAALAIGRRPDEPAGPPSVEDLERWAAALRAQRGDDQ